MKKTLMQLVLVWVVRGFQDPTQAIRFVDALPHDRMVESKIVYTEEAVGAFQAHYQVFFRAEGPKPKDGEFVIHIGRPDGPEGAITIEGVPAKRKAELASMVKGEVGSAATPEQARRAQELKKGMKEISARVDQLAAGDASGLTERRAQYYRKRNSRVGELMIELDGKRQRGETNEALQKRAQLQAETELGPEPKQP